jgi:hypothetical protein
MAAATFRFMQATAKTAIRRVLGIRGGQGEMLVLMVSNYMSVCAWLISTFLFRHSYGPRSQHNSRESQRRSKLRRFPFPTKPTLDWTFLTISLAGFHLGTMADAVMYLLY